MSRQTRRTFLKKTAAASAGIGLGLTIGGTKSSGQVVGANDAVRLGVAGLNGRGGDHIRSFGSQRGVQITYLIDPDSSLHQRVARSVRGNTPTCVQDIRKALDDKELDAISIATPNHWHSLMAIWACQAGKDVYVEKPVSHNPFEGRKVVEAAAKYNRVVQHGTQRRSQDDWNQWIAALASGKYGKLKVSYGYASKPRGSLGFKPVQEPPKELDFDIWLGPAAKHDFHRNLVHYNWHWFWDFGSGEIGNQGAHEMDVALWAVMAATGLKGPKRVCSIGGRYGYEDQGQTPNTQLSFFDFGDVKIFFEDYGLDPDPAVNTNVFYTDLGVIKPDPQRNAPGHLSESNFRFYPNGSTAGESLARVETTNSPGNNFQNFINCVRDRTPEKLNSKIEPGHLAIILCHLANASYRLGELVPFSKVPDLIADDEAGVQAFERMKTNLVKATGMNLDNAQYRLGKTLDYDIETERFVGNDEANKWLAPEYRAPFVVPREV